MKRHRQAICRTVAVSLLSLLAVSLATGAPSTPSVPATGASVAPPAADKEVPKAVFEQNAGRDPFFPNSTRHASVKPGPGKTNTVQSSQFVLKGITSQPKPTAMVNDKVFEVGDEDNVKVADGTRVRVRCLEITEQSAVIEVGNPPQRVELRLRFGL